MVDHVKQYKIPRQYMYLSDSDKEKEKDNSSNEDSQSKEDNSDPISKLEKKQFKPTGPDSRSWGDFRKSTHTEEIIIEELAQMQLQEEQRRQKTSLMQNLKKEQLAAIKTESLENLTED